MLKAINSFFDHLLCAIHLTYDIDYTHTLTVLLPCMVEGTEPDIWLFSKIQGKNVRGGKKRKKSSGAYTQDDAKGESDSPAADEPAATEGTSSSAPPPKKKQSLKSRMERKAELLNAIMALQGQVDVLKHDLSKAKKAALAPVEWSSLDESVTVGMDEVDSDHGAYRK